MKLNQTKLLLAASAGLLAWAGPIIADDSTSGHSGLESLEVKQDAQQLQINPGFTYVADADFDDSSLGDVSVWRADIPARYILKTEHGDLGLGAFYEYSRYELGNLDDEDFNFNTLAFDAFWKGMVNENWGYFVYGAISLAADTDENLGDGVTGMGGGGVRYVWSEALSLGLGAVVASRLEDDPMVWPVVALNWQIDDRWNLRTLNGATLTYDITEDKTWQADVGVKYQRREYRIRDDSSLTEKMFSAELGATYRCCANAAIRAFVGVAAGREFEIRHNDDKVGDEDVDTAPFFGVRAMLTF